MVGTYVYQFAIIGILLWPGWGLSLWVQNSPDFVTLAVEGKILMEWSIKSQYSSGSTRVILKTENNSIDTEDILLDV